MKKILFMFAAVSMMISAASCSKDDTKKSGEDENNTPTEQVSRVFDDFEGEGKLTWTGSNGAAFELAANPSKTGINTSAQVGKITASGAQWEFAWSTAFGGEDIDFVNFSTEGYIVRVDVYSPKAGSPVYLKFEGVDVPAVEITNVTTTKVNEWETLEFDYEPFTMADGAYKNFVILFDAGVETSGGEVFYFDNLRLCKE